MNQYQFQAPSLTKMNKIILITAGACFLLGAILNSIGAFSLVHLLGLSSGGINQGFLFQLVTYPFIETQLMGFIFSALIVWFIGSELESLWGARVYTRFLLLTIVGVGIIYSIIHLGMNVYSAPLHGLSGMNFALLTAYAVLYPDRQMSLMMIFPMRARTFCLILAAIEAYLAIFSSHTSSWPHLFAMLIGFLIIHFQSAPLIKKVLNSSFTPSRRKKNHLYVVKKDDEKPPKYWQ